MKLPSIAEHLPRIFLIFFVLLVNYSPLLGQSPQTAEVTYAGTAEPGTVLVRVVGYGNRESLAMEEAQVKAFQTLLFRGIPGSDQKQPLVENESSSRQEHEAFYEEFFQKQRYKSFLMQSTPNASLKKKAGRKQMVVTIKINLEALRRDMEQHQVIRKFGL